ncbi:unnamed protein product [Cyprideis torosa]|uniref:Uncharacterized protein n=1 Tax=Cyprideis torosa TaxID=163714 RepID=A0A7R8ZK97_9CRUS|nr:unnamed protein product [Cyprideis torosa]CAG0884024.1 unnamed protein product [Cyprideis torosa]
MGYLLVLLLAGELFFLRAIEACEFVGLILKCSLDFGGVELHVTGVVNPCSLPLDATFVLKSSEPPLRWAHTFVTTNPDEEVLIQGLRTSGENKEVTFRASFQTDFNTTSDVKTIAVQAFLQLKDRNATEPPVPFVDGIVSIRNDVECDLSGSGQAAPLRIFMFFGLLSLTVVLLLIILLILLRRQQALKLVERLHNSLARFSRGGVPYQEETKTETTDGANGQVVVNGTAGGDLTTRRNLADGEMETSLIIPNPVSLARSSSVVGSAAEHLKRPGVTPPFEGDQRLRGDGASPTGSPAASAIPPRSKAVGGARPKTLPSVVAMEVDPADPPDSLEEDEEMLATAGPCLPHFVTVEFPGYVQSVERAKARGIQDYFGGVKKMSHVFLKNSESPQDTTSASERQLQLRWRKDDPYAKPLIAERTKAWGLLVKVRRRKRRLEDQGAEQPLKVEVLGLVKDVYKFTTLPDYQMLPYDHRTGQSIREDVTLGFNLEEFDKCQAGILYLPPPYFPRLETEFEVKFRPKEGELADPLDPSLCIKGREGQGRNRVSLGTYRISYDESVPSKPIKDIQDTLERWPAFQDLYDRCVKLFQERPIWSRNRISAFLGLKPGDYEDVYGLKVILPLVSYYSMLGPWRNSWIRMNFDPKFHPECRNFQILDIRVKKQLQRKLKVPAKSDQLPPTFLYRFDPEDVMNIKQRQAFFHYSDVEIPEMKEILALPVRDSCDKAEGFFPDGTNERLRSLVKGYLSRALSGGDEGLVDEDDEKRDEEEEEEEEIEFCVDQAAAMEISSPVPGGSCSADVMTHGFPSAKPGTHPIQSGPPGQGVKSLRADARNGYQDLNMEMLKKVSGVHFPMKLQMELWAASQVGRLPCLPSSHLMRDTLLGRDEIITFGDYLDHPDHKEEMGNPHAVIEKNLGILK